MMQVDQKKTILLVEDQAILAIAEANILKKNGFDVLITSNGREAIKIATEHSNLNLILMDIDLGKGMDGTEAAQIILKDRELPIVFLSSHTEKEIVDKTEKITSYGYVIKNSGETVLIASIKMAFQLFEANQKIKNELAERKRTEEALALSEEKYKRIVENLNQAYYEADRKGVFTYCNPGLLLIAGYSEKELLGTISFNLVADEYRKEIVAIYKQSLRQKKMNLTTEFKVQTKKGQKFWVEQTTHFDFDENGVFNNANNIIRNIDERKQAEEALRVSEQRLRYALEGSSYGIWDWNLTTNDVYFSPRYYKMLGYKPGEFKPTYNAWLELLHPEDVEKTVASQKKAFSKSEPFETEFRMRCKDGSYCWILFRGKIAEKDEDGRVKRFTGSHQDINNRKIAEQKLESLNNKLIRIINLAPIGIGITINRVFMEANDQFCKMVGYTREELVQHRTRIIYPDDKEYEYAGNEKIKQIDEYGVSNVETKWKRKDGTIINALLSTATLEDNNIHEEMIFTALDITHRKKSELLLKNYSEEKEALHRELLHRVKNSFNQIKSLFYFEREKISDPKACKIFENLEMRIGTLSEMYSLLNESGVSEEIELGEYINRIICFLSQTYIEEEHRIKVKTFFDKIIVIPKTASTVGLIINEILTNSLKYAFPENKKGTISISLKAKNGNAEIDISDNGVGLPANFKIEDSSGMGLQLVNMLIQQLNGKITIESKDVTKFSFVFPTKG